MVDTMGVPRPLLSYAKRDGFNSEPEDASDRNAECRRCEGSDDTQAHHEHSGVGRLGGTVSLDCEAADERNGFTISDFRFGSSETTGFEIRQGSGHSRPRTGGEGAGSVSWVGTNEAAQYCGVHPNTILIAAQSKKLKGSQRVKPHGRWKFKLSDLDRWMQS